MFYAVNFKIKNRDGIFRHCHSLDVMCNKTVIGEFYYTVIADCFGYDHNGKEYKEHITIKTSKVFTFNTPEEAFEYVDFLCSIYPPNCLDEYDDRDWNIEFAPELHK